MAWELPSQGVATGAIGSGLDETPSLGYQNRARVANLAGTFSNSFIGALGRASYRAGLEVGDDTPNISLEEAGRMAEEAGVKLSGIGRNGISPRALDYLIDHQKHEQERARIVQNARLSPWETGIESFIFGAVSDPVNYISFGGGLAIGGVRSAGYAIRVARGAAVGAGAAAALEAPYAAAMRYGGEDYTLADSLTNVAIGSVLGGGFEALGEGVARYMNRKHARTVALQQATLDHPIEPLADPGGVTDVRGDFRSPTDEEWAVVSREIQKAGFGDLTPEEITTKVKAIREQLDAEGVPHFTPEEWRQALADIQADTARARTAAPEGPTSPLGDRMRLSERPLEGGPPARDVTPSVIAAEINRYLAERTGIDTDYHAARINQKTRQERLDAAKVKKDAKLAELASGLKAGDLSDADFKTLSRQVAEAHPKMVKDAGLDTLRAELKAEATTRLAKDAARSPADVQRLKQYQSEVLDQGLETIKQRFRVGEPGGPHTLLRGAGQRLADRSRDGLGTFPKSAEPILEAARMRPPPAVMTPERLEAANKELATDALGLAKDAELALADDPTLAAQLKEDLTTIATSKKNANDFLEALRSALICRSAKG